MLLVYTVSNRKMIVAIGKETTLRVVSFVLENVLFLVLLLE